MESHLRAITRVVQPTEHLEAVPDDADDNKIIECAVAGRRILMPLNEPNRSKCSSPVTTTSEPGYEINPFYQRDIDALRAWSPRFLTMLTVNVLFLWTVWSWSISDFDSGLYLIVLGSLLLTELVVHIRHVRNWFLFRTIIRLGGIRDASNTLDASCWRCRRSRSSRLPGCLRSSSSSPATVG
jgi:hypothetical protein